MPIQLPPELIQQIITHATPLPTTWSSHHSRNSLLLSLSLVSSLFLPIAQEALKHHIYIDLYRLDRIKRIMEVLDDEDDWAGRTKSVELSVWSGIGRGNQPKREVRELLRRLGKSVNVVWVEGMENASEVQVLGSDYFPNLEALHLRDFNIDIAPLPRSFSLTSLRLLTVSRSDTFDWSLLTRCGPRLTTLTIQHLTLLQRGFEEHWPPIAAHLTRLTIEDVLDFRGHNPLEHCTRLEHLIYINQPTPPLSLIQAPLLSLSVHHDSTTAYRVRTALSLPFPQVFGTIRRLEVTRPSEKTFGKDETREEVERWAEELERECEGRRIALMWVE